jgi:hypothetical protein
MQRRSCTLTPCSRVRAAARKASRVRGSPARRARTRRRGHRRQHQRLLAPATAPGGRRDRGRWRAGGCFELAPRARTQRRMKRTRQQRGERSGARPRAWSVGLGCTASFRTKDARPAVPRPDRLWPNNRLTARGPAREQPANDDRPPRPNGPVYRRSTAMTQAHSGQTRTVCPPFPAHNNRHGPPGAKMILTDGQPEQVSTMTPPAYTKRGAARSLPQRLGIYSVDIRFIAVDSARSSNATRHR